MTESNGIAPSRTLLSTPCNAAASNTELVEPVAYKQDPDCGENGIHDYGYIQARYRNDPKDARDQAQISRALTEDSREHDQTDHENLKGENDYGVDSFQAGCQHCRRIICSRDIGHPLGFVRGCGVVAAESDERGVIRPGNCQV